MESINGTGSFGGEFLLNPESVPRGGAAATQAVVHPPHWPYTYADMTGFALNVAGPLA